MTPTKLILPFTLLPLLSPLPALNAAPEDEFVKELAPGVFFRKAATAPEFTGCNQGWVVFKDFVLVVDANFPNQADKVIKIIRQHSDKPIRYIFDTHHHGDHADGNPIYTKLGAAAVASEASRKGFETVGIEGFARSKKSKPAEYGPLKYEFPSVYFPKKLILDDGEQRVELIHFGHGHTIGDAVAWVPKHGILFTGDSCVNGAFNYTGEADVESWIQVLNRMEELPVKVLAPGHGELGDKAVIATQRRYFIELRATVGRMMKSGKSLNEIKESITLPWYKDWTGVDIKERTENIEKTYRDLMADKLYQKKK